MEATKKLNRQTISEENKKKEKDKFSKGIFKYIQLNVSIYIIVLGLVSTYLNYRSASLDNTAISAQQLNFIYLNIAATVILIIVSIITSIIASNGFSKKISEPIIFCGKKIKDISEGNLTDDFSFNVKSDAIGELIQSVGATVAMLNNIINNISYHLGAIAHGDFTTDIELNYVGDFSTIGSSLKTITNSLNDMMSKINESSKQVAINAEQMAEGAQSLSQGASEQASSIEELAATVNEISTQISNNALNSEKAKQAALEAANEVESGSKQIKNMISAMDEISNSSAEIGKIIKAIEDIAFQTNILALNAAVEAARAGTAGEGFAVVADEVRNLASKSAEAAKNTTELIENSIQAIFNGTKIAQKTNDSLNLIINKTNLTLHLVEEIADATEQQSVSASQIVAGTDQISYVVQNNSATAEESAASSKELSRQAQVLKNIIDGVKIRA